MLLARASGDSHRHNSTANQRALCDATCLNIPVSIPPLSLPEIS